MLNNKPDEVVTIAATRSSGLVSRMQISVRKTVGSLSPEYAEREGFVLSDDKLEWTRKLSDETIQSYVDRIALDDFGPVASWRRVNPEDFPPAEHDELFKAARFDNGEKIVIDMDKARAIHMDRIRAAREPMLEALDRQWMKATGQGKGAEATQIEAQRQELRDVPQTLDLSKAETVEDLKAIWLDDPFEPVRASAK